MKSARACVEITCDLDNAEPAARLMIFRPQGFSFDGECGRCKDPDRDAMPDTSAGRSTQDDAFAELLTAIKAAGPPRPKATRSGGDGGMARFVPDPRYDGRALQLACAITERVDAQDPVHRRDLVLDIRALLKAGDAAQNLPGDKVAEVARELTTARVTLDAKLALAARLDGEKFDRPLFLRNVGSRNPDPRNMHPLGYASPQTKGAYDRDAGRQVQRALDENPEPTQAELSVARIVALPNLPERSAGLLESLRYIFQEGSLKPVDDLLRDREALLAEIAETKESPKKSEGFLEQVFRTFTHREVFALARSDKRLPGTVPTLDETHRTAVAQGLSTITKNRGLSFTMYAWQAAAESLEDRLHPERARSRSRGMGLGM